MRGWSVAILLVLVAAAAAMELAFRFVGLGDPIVYFTNLTYRYAPMPAQQATRFDGAVITINRHGLRATQEWDAPADLRLLFVGDSFTWGGSSITDTDTFAERTCLLVGQTLGVRAVCGNAGVNGYGTDNMTRRIRHGGIDDEDWIIVSVLPGDAERSLQNILSGQYALVKPTGLLRGSWEAATWFTYTWNLKLRGANERMTREELHAVARDSVRALIEALKGKERAGKRVLVLMSGLTDEITTPNERRLTPMVREELANSGLKFLDLLAMSRQRYRPHYCLDGGHLSRAGHALVAEEIAGRVIAAQRAPR